jgi:D-sedoheptulose 7-phosphate isomerase
MAALCDLRLHALSDSTPLIQQIHITAGHIIGGLVEERFFPRAARPG